MNINTTHFPLKREVTVPQSVNKRSQKGRDPDVSERISQKVGVGTRKHVLQIVESEIRNLLDLPAENEKPSVYPLSSPIEFSSEAIADRLLNSFASSIVRAQKSGKDEMDLQKMIELAGDQLRQGAAGVDELLSKLGAEGALEKIDKIVNGLQKGLGRLSANLEMFQPQLQNGGDIERERYFSLQLVTLDGDRIDVAMQLSTSSKSELKLQWQNDGIGFRLDTEDGVSSSIKYKIHGSLDEREQHVLEQVLAGVDKMADNFFAGKWSGGAPLNYDESIISAYKLVSGEKETGNARAELRAGAIMPERNSPHVDQVKKMLADKNKQSVVDLLKLLDSVKLFEKSEEALKSMVQKRLEIDPRHVDGDEQEELLPISLQLSA